MSMNKMDLLKIPDTVQAQVPCLSNPSLFQDSALDIDMDDDSWVEMDLTSQQEKVLAKFAAEERAKNACLGCVILDSCNVWITDLEKDPEKFVSGVVAAKSEEERRGEQIILSNPTERGPLGQVREDLITRWANSGIPKSDIANRLNCHPRTVEHHLAGIKESQIVQHNPALTSGLSVDIISPSTLTVRKAVRVASTALQPARITAETAALFDALIDGAQRDRSEIVDSILYSVERNVGLAKAPTKRKYIDEEAKFKIGARKFLMNRVDITVRSGRIVEGTTNAGRKLISLEPETATIWREWRKANV